MRLRYDEATDSVVVVDETCSQSEQVSSRKADINPKPDWNLQGDSLSGRYFYDDEIGVYSPGGNYPSPDMEKPKGPQIIKDIEGYRTAAGDIASGGKRIHIGSRSRHREFLRDNRYVEVGNDYDKRQVDDRQPRRQSKADFIAQQQQRVQAIKNAVNLVRTGRVAEHFNVNRHEE